MRFACQSCGKAYNLPEERIAEKSNVKLKCRVCGAIVEVKRHGEIVAQLLSELEGKAPARVSEAPAPLTSITPEDPEDATAAIAIGDPALGEERILPPLPPPPATGFAMAPLPPPPPRAEAQPPRSEPSIAPPLPPPAALSPVAAPPPPRGMASELPVMNGSNGAGAHGMHMPPLPPESGGQHEEGHDSMLGAMPATVPGMAGAMPSVAPMANAMAASGASETGAVAALNPMMNAEPTSMRTESDDTNKKMVAAFLTGIVVDRIIAGLFF